MFITKTTQTLQPYNKKTEIHNILLSKFLRLNNKIITDLINSMINGEKVVVFIKYLKIKLKNYSIDTKKPHKKCSHNLFL